MYIQKFKAFNILSEISQSIIVNDELLPVLFSSLVCS